MEEKNDKKHKIYYVLIKVREGWGVFEGVLQKKVTQGTNQKLSNRLKILFNMMKKVENQSEGNSFSRCYIFKD